MTMPFQKEKRRMKGKTWPGPFFKNNHEKVKTLPQGMGQFQIDTFFLGKGFSERFFEKLIRFSSV